MNHSHVRAARRPLVAVIAALTALAASVLIASPVHAADEQPQTSWVRAGHLVPGMGGVSVDLTPVSGGKPTVLAGEVDYGTIGDYEQVPSGVYTVSVRAPNAGASSPAMLSATLEAEPGAGYTIAGLGTKSDPSVRVLGDDLTPPEQGQARVRLVNATADLGAIDVSVDGGNVLARDAARGEPTGYASVPAGSWDLDVTAKGAEPVRSNVTVDASSVYTLIVTGTSADAVEVQSVVDSEGTATMPKGAPETGRPATGGVPAWATGLLGGSVLAAAALGVAALRGRRTVR